jgi:transcriptional regulator with XRE-family HTH domain
MNVRTQSPPIATEQTVGDAVRRLREGQRITVRTLAARAGFSPSFISQVENGQASPSIHSLEHIVSCLGVTLGGFFNALEPREAAVTRAAERRQLTSGWSKARIESLGPGGAGVVMEPVLVTLSAGGSSGKSASPQTHEQFLFLLEGEIALTLGDEEIIMSAGDSARIPASQPRKMQNRGTVLARVLIVSARVTL